MGSPYLNQYITPSQRALHSRAINEELLTLLLPNTFAMLRKGFHWKGDNMT